MVTSHEATHTSARHPRRDVDTSSASAQEHKNARQAAPHSQTALTAQACFLSTAAVAAFVSDRQGQEMTSDDAGQTPQQRRPRNDACVPTQDRADEAIHAARSSTPRAGSPGDSQRPIGCPSVCSAVEAEDTCWSLWTERAGSISIWTCDARRDVLLPHPWRSLQESNSTDSVKPRKLASALPWRDKRDAPEAR